MYIYICILGGFDSSVDRCNACQTYRFQLETDRCAGDQRDVSSKFTCQLVVMVFKNKKYKDGNPYEYIILYCMCSSLQIIHPSFSVKNLIATRIYDAR